jgi:hypothetical protein
VSPLWRFRGRAPLAVAALLSFPIFIASLMASSLALEKPVVLRWTHAGKVITRYQDASNATELRIWLFALIPPLLVLAAGVLAMWLPRGVYLAALVAIAGALVLPLRIDTWVRHHTTRFPDGIDLLREDDTSNLLSPGQWEGSARHVVYNLQRWTLALGLAVILIAALVELRRRRGTPPPPPPPPAIAGDVQQTVTSGSGLSPGPFA